MVHILHAMRRLLCGIVGHQTILHFEHDRLSLQCLTCGYRSRGWRLGPEVPRAPLSTDGGSSVRVRAAAHPLGIAGATGGVRFADRSGRADRFGGESDAPTPRSQTGHAPAMRLAS